MVVNKLLHGLLVASATLLRVATAENYHDQDGMIEERILHDDGTVGVFAMHPSFVPAPAHEVPVLNGTEAERLEDLRAEVRAGNVSAGLEGIELMRRNIPVLPANASHPSGNFSTPGSSNNLTDDFYSRHFHSGSSARNYTMCGWGVPFPMLGKEIFTSRPDTRDCFRLWGMWFNRWGYYQLEDLGHDDDAQAFNELARYDTCKMWVRRLDLDNDGDKNYGARVGNADILWWLAGAMVVSVGSEWENPLNILYMAPVSGSIGCQDLGPNDVAILEFEIIRNEKSPKPTVTTASGDIPAATSLPASVTSLLAHATPRNGECEGPNCYNGINK